MIPIQCAAIFGVRITLHTAQIDVYDTKSNWNQLDFKSKCLTKFYSNSAQHFQIVWCERRIPIELISISFCQWICVWEWFCFYFHSNVFYFLFEMGIGIVFDFDHFNCLHLNDYLGNIPLDFQRYNNWASRQNYIQPH